MRLFHVSEEPDITVFHPRLPARADLDPNVGLVWAIDEARLPNFLTPRDCPRVTYYVGENTTEADRERFLPAGFSHAVFLEEDWRERMQHTVLTLYEMDPAEFMLQDPVAGYYVAKTMQIPVAVHTITDPVAELQRRKVLVCFTENLWPLAESIQKSTLHWSLCRMKNAKARPEKTGGIPYHGK